MKVFILILTMIVGDSQVAVIEFSSRETCEKAGDAAVTKWNRGFSSVSYICVEK